MRKIQEKDARKSAAIHDIDVVLRGIQNTPTISDEPFSKILAAAVVVPPRLLLRVAYIGPLCFLSCVCVCFFSFFYSVFLSLSSHFPSFPIIIRFSVPVAIPHISSSSKSRHVPRPISAVIVTISIQQKPVYVP